MSGVRTPLLGLENYLRGPAVDSSSGWLKAVVDRTFEQLLTDSDSGAGIQLVAAPAETEILIPCYRVLEWYPTSTVNSILDSGVILTFQHGADFSADRVFDTVDLNNFFSDEVSKVAFAPPRYVNFEETLFDNGVYNYPVVGAPLVAHFSSALTLGSELGTHPEGTLRFTMYYLVITTLGVALGGS